MSFKDVNKLEVSTFGGSQSSPSRWGCLHKTGQNGLQQGPHGSLRHSLPLQIRVLPGSEADLLIWFKSQHFQMQQYSRLLHLCHHGTVLPEALWGKGSEERCVSRLVILWRQYNQIRDLLSVHRGEAFEEASLQRRSQHCVMSTGVAYIDY